MARIRMLWLLCAVALMLSQSGPPVVSAAVQGNQGLQGGWSVDDGGRVNFLHAASQQYPIMQDAGAGWVRVNFRLGACFTTWVPGTACSTADGPTALDVYDVVIQNALDRNLRVVGLLSNESWPGSRADWIANNAENNPTNDPTRTGDNPYVKAFAEQAVRPLVNRYKGKVAQWEIWNEPNAYESVDAAGNPVGGTFIYPSNFAWLLKRAHAEVRAAGGTVISGGVLGHDATAGHATILVENGARRRVVVRGTLKDTRLERGRQAPARPGVAPEPLAAAAASCEQVPSGADYLCSTYDVGIAKAGWAVYKAQAGTYPLDQVGQHLYIDQGGATSSRNLTTFLAEVRNAYLRSEGSKTAKQTHVTEVGWETVGTLSPQLQAQNLQAAFGTFRTTRYVGRAFWFNVQDIDEASPDVLFGLVQSGYDARSPNPALKKPSFAAYQKYATY